MKILIDIGHPAHVHLFKNFAFEMQKKGNELLFTCREKEFEIELLEHYELNYKSFGKKFNTKVGKIWGIIVFSFKEYFTGLKFKPDLFISHGSMYASYSAALLGKPHISLEDTFNFEQIRLYKPFSNCILSGAYAHPVLGNKEINYNGYHELAYLHKNYFTPDKNIIDELGVKENEKYVMLRFVAWNATHDIGHKGINFFNKIKAINEFQKYARVFISSESELPEELRKYKIIIPPHRIHDALAFSSLLFGESATMATECSMLGIPSVFIDSTGRFYTKDLEKNYGLIFNYSELEIDQIRAIEKGVELLTTPNLKTQWQEKRSKMLVDKIDVTAFLVWFVENYPESVKVMKENPEYQYKFK